MNKLNLEQQSVVDSNSSRILCLAGAGTGKSHTMLARISRLVDEGVPPNSILALTFTNAAAFEMKDRYTRNHVGEVIPEFRTFHSFCYSLLVRDRNVLKQMGYNSIPKVADPVTSKRAETKAVIDCNIKLSTKKLSGKEPLTVPEKFQYDLYKKAVDKNLKAENLITFDKLCYGICEMFVNDLDIIQYYKEKYKYIFVDEFQDTDEKQWRFVSSFKDANLMVIGDALQAIYSFRGADSSIIKALSKDESWETIKLSRNYRSTSQICDFANRMSTYADKNYRIPILSEKEGEKVGLGKSLSIKFSEPVDLVMMDTIVDIWNSKSEGTGAVLCRTNTEVDEVCKILDKKEVAYSTGKRDTDPIHILKSLTNNQYMLDWLSTYLNADRYAEWIRLQEIDSEPDKVKLFTDTYGRVRAINIRLTAIYQIRNILRDNKKSVISRFADMIKVLGIKNITLDVEISSLSELIQYTVEAIESAQSSDLYVGTIHSSKGLEYDTVFLVGVDDHSFKLKNEENLNLYYVGITRAKNNLYVFRR